MLKHLTDTLHQARNPLLRVKHRFPRYVLITACCGTFSFLVALVLLHTGFPPFFALVVSALSSGLISYTAMELWAFPHREGRLSWKRLFQNALVGIGGFSARAAVLQLGLAYLAVPPPFHKAAPLALAYISSFLIGYLLRSRVIFRH